MNLAILEKRNADQEYALLAADMGTLRRRQRKGHSTTKSHDACTATITTWGQSRGDSSGGRRIRFEKHFSGCLRISGVHTPACSLREPKALPAMGNELINQRRMGGLAQGSSRHLTCSYMIEEKLTWASKKQNPTVPLCRPFHGSSFNCRIAEYQPLLLVHCHQIPVSFAPDDAGAVASSAASAASLASVSALWCWFF